MLPSLMTTGCVDQFIPNSLMMSHNSHNGISTTTQIAIRNAGGCGAYYPSSRQIHHQPQHMPLSRQHSNYMMSCYSQNANGWAGVPLISTAVRRPRKPHHHHQQQQQQQNQILHHENMLKQRIMVSRNTMEYDENAMSRLALHAHGVPLILTGRYRTRSQKYQHSSPGQTTQKASQHAVRNEKNYASESKNSTDTVSITSDESLSNGNVSTDMSLPRIIKPRKRRKKDRKIPNNLCLNVDNNYHSKSSGSTIQSTQNHYPSNRNYQSTNIPTSSSLRFEIPLLVSEQPVFTSSMNRENSNFILNLSERIPTKSPESVSSSSTNSNSYEGENTTSACYCRLCDPSCRIWAFPLRRSFSDNSAEMEIQRNKDVGVIGSNRSWNKKSEWYSSSFIEDQRIQDINFQRHDSSSSESNESVCDLLSGIDFGEELFSINKNKTSMDLNKRYPLTSPTTAVISPSNPIETNFDFSSAESLLTESINEISKKLMETIDLRSNDPSEITDSEFTDTETALTQGLNETHTSNDENDLCSDLLSNCILSDNIILNLESIAKNASLLSETNRLFIDSNQSNIYDNIQCENQTNWNSLSCWNNNHKLLLPIEDRIQLQSNG